MDRRGHAELELAIALRQNKGRLAAPDFLVMRPLQRTRLPGQSRASVVARSIFRHVAGNGLFPFQADPIAIDALLKRLDRAFENGDATRRDGLDSFRKQGDRLPDRSRCYGPVKEDNHLGCLAPKRDFVAAQSIKHFAVVIAKPQECAGCGFGSLAFRCESWIGVG